MLSFEEFRAVKNREAQLKEPLPTNKKGGEKVVKKTKPNAAKLDEFSPEPKPDVKPQTPTKKTTWRQSLGEFLELNQTQYLYLIILLLDTFAAFAEITLAAKGSKKITLITRSLRILQAFTSFTSLFYTLEIILSYLAFGFVLVGHWGYLLDTVVISCQVAWEYVGIGHETRLLNIFRVWRLFRLLFAIISVEKQANEQLKGVIAEKEATLGELEGRVNDLGVEIKKEQDARRAVEDMLLNYKEEVDTLNEALKIAAMDIAEVGQDEEDMLSLDSEEVDDVLEAKDDASRSLGSQRKADKLNSLMSVSSVNSSQFSEDKAPMFIIKEDGSYLKS